jgi:hypothetical protein
MEGVPKKDLAQAQKTVDNLMNNKSIMNESKSQIDKTISDFESVLKDPKSSKQLKEMATRGLDKFGNMQKQMIGLGY